MQHRATVTEINRNLAATLKLCGPALISDPTTLKPVTETLLAIITKKHGCQQDFGDTEDIEDLEESSEYDWLVIDTALDAVNAVANCLGETFGQLWKMFEKPIMRFASGSEAYERSTSIGVIAECIRAMGKEVTPSTTSLLKLLLHRMSDEDPETKSNAAYAVGLLQENSRNDQEILKSYNAILGKLEPLLHTHEARAMDNAAGCVSRMIMKHQAHVPIAAVLPALIEILPLKEDFEENEPVYNMIVNLCQSTLLIPHPIQSLNQLTSSHPNRFRRRTHNHKSHPANPPRNRRGHGPTDRAAQRFHPRAADPARQIRPQQAAGPGPQIRVFSHGRERLGRAFCSFHHHGCAARSGGRD